MAEIVYRANLKTASFAFLSELFGRSVIVRKQDQNYVTGLAPKEAIDSSLGIPQVYYLHNVIPSEYGYKSVGYIDYITAAYPSTTNFGNTVNLRDDNGNSAILSVDAVGNVYVLEAGSVVWASPSGAPSAASIAGKRVTAAYVAGVSYIYFAGVGCYTYNWTTNALSSVTLTGLVAADILGLVANGGYLIAYSINAIAWSSLTAATDFTPSLETGAGGGSVEGINGRIVTIEEVYGGLIIFAENNAVAGIASNNVRYPFNFVPVTGSGGLRDPNHTAQDTGSGSVYAYTTSGLQVVNLKQAVPIFPEVTDYVSGGLYEDFNEITLELELIDASGTEVQKRLALIADRYLIMSYGATSLNFAIYYDIAYKQFGRLKIDHVDCFEFNSYASGTTEIAKKSIAFLTSGGGVKILDPDIDSPNSSGVMLLGKYQYVRERMLVIQRVAFENVNPGATFNLYHMPSLDGKNLLAASAAYLASSAGKLRNYFLERVGLNHTLAAVGSFNAVSLVIAFTVHGEP